MYSFAKSTLMGKVQNEPQSTCTANGMHICQFQLCVKTGYKKENTKGNFSYFNIRMWGKLAESLGSKITAGTQLLCDGTPKQEQWKATDGQNRSKIVFDVLSVVLMGGNNNKEEQDQVPKQEASPFEEQGPSAFTEDDIPY